MRLPKKQLFSAFFLFYLVSGFSETVPENLVASKKTVSFIENKGQIIDQDNLPNPDVLFLLNNPGMNVQLRRGGFSYDLYSVTYPDMSADSTSEFGCPASRSEEEITPWRDGIRHPASEIRFHRIDLDLIGADPSCGITASGASSDFLNYYTTGTPAEGVTFVRHYQKVVYEGIYPGVDLEFVYDEATGFKYNFILHPGADLSAITLRIKGPLSIAESDETLLLETVFGTVKESIPESYLLDEGDHRKAEARFYRIGENLFGVSIVEPIPNGMTLVVDPVPDRLWATYCGGSGLDEIRECIMGGGDLYVSGKTASSSNIATTGSHQATIGGNDDAFLAKFNSEGVRLWGTYYGGSSNDFNAWCAYDPGGNIFLSGTTNSVNNISTPGAHQEVFGGAYDAFIAKFTSDGIRLWGTYYGGTGIDDNWGCKVMGNSSVVMSGTTYSDSGISTPGSHQETKSNANDGFIVLFTPGGVRQWGTYYGGNGSEAEFRCSNNSTDQIYVYGRTSSANNISTSGSHQETIGGNYDGFLVKFDTSCVRQWGTYYGGTLIDGALDCVSLQNGDLLISGYTISSAGISTAGAYQEIIGGSFDAFFAKFNDAGVRQWGTYYGGAQNEFGNSISLIDSSFILFIGSTYSSDNIATVGAYQESLAGARDAFMVKFDSACNREWATYYGGTNDEEGFTSDVISDSVYFLAGRTQSMTGISSPGAHQEVFGGIEDGFIVQFTECIPPGSTGPITGSDEVCEASSGHTYSIDPVLHALDYIWTLSPGATIISGAGTTTIQVDFASGATSGELSVYGENTCGHSDTATLDITVNPLPYVAFVLCDTLTSRDAQPILLRGGIIPGGDYSGPGVAAGYFDPAALPAGEDTAVILYTYTSGEGCIDSVTRVITVLDAPTFTCGAPVTDIRDGQTYPTVLIGTQCWMSANLNFGDRIDLSSTPLDNCSPEKYCYEDDFVSCNLKGGLYTWDEVMQYVTTEGAQGICLPGWHVPTEPEWQTLFDQFSGQAYAGDAIKTGGASGLEGLLTGVEFNYTEWHFADSTGFFWSSSSHGIEKAWAHGIHIVNHGVSFYPSNNSNAFSIRCLKD